MRLLKMLGQYPSVDKKKYYHSLPNYKNGKFQNTLTTPALLEGETMTRVLLSTLNKVTDAFPVNPIPHVVTDLKNLHSGENSIIWFGHSSYMLQVDGKVFLVDPVFSGNASPLPGSIRAFHGADYYKPDHMPEIDVLLITHDHWDHLDYKTVQALQSKVKRVICGLGVGQHFEYWGWDNNKIIEKNWNETVDLHHGFTVTLTPARHFSGRLFNRNISLWTSYVLQTPSHTLFLGGDSGYGDHFEIIGKEHGPFDLAILECGQYNEKWPYIHSMPSQIITEARELNARAFMPVHHSKFKLGQHSWHEPLTLVSRYAEEENMQIVTPKIGEKVQLGQLHRTWEKWW